jgi:hypothetical protein
MAIKKLVVIGFLLAGTVMSFRVSAQEPMFPLLQDGGPRIAFVSGFYESCFKQTKGKITDFSTPVIADYCLCSARATADSISGADYEALLLGKQSEGFGKKLQSAADLCTAKITMSDPMSEHERERRTLIIQCMKEYHPEDPEYAAAVLREKYCGCFAGFVAKSSKTPKSPSEASDYCGNFSHYAD